MTLRLFSLFVLIVLALGCNTTKPAVSTSTSNEEEPIAEVTVEERQLDTMVISAPKPNDLKRAEEYKLPLYNPTYTLKNDLIHTKLDLRFDWAKQHVMGTATLTLKPYFYSTSTLTLDAKGFEIKNIVNTLSNKPLLYDYDGQQLIIQLGKTYSRTEEYNIQIDYVARPAESGMDQGGAITSDQGLFFINHDGKDPNKPMQIWTQGETEYNSRWFPTIDKPNERCTQELSLTVEDKYRTLSNGTLVSSTKNNDGTRTDYWKMDKPHAPYLFMIAVGEFAVVKDKWRNTPLEYYVEPKYEPYAKEIFNHTPEMIEFFSNYTGVDYPWAKYSQVIVRDYVSGAMENTTGVIFGEFVQKTDRELIDDNNDFIVAHELFHHWFGDLVTCESWANLTMNEGFANYSEYLWTEYKYGSDRAENHRLNEMQGYFGSVNQGGAHPLIHFGHEDKEDMFDAHSYNKGGLVLHMLRQQIGDDAFRSGLKKYLTDNAYTAVEAHNLRLAMEAVTGEDLNWFFNQWYFAAGHPELEINYDYDADAKKINVIVEQKQDPDKFPAIFELPFAIDVYIGKRAPIRHDVVMKERKQTFTFDAIEEPALVNVDAEKYLLIEKNDNKSESNYIFQYYNAKNYMDRFEALSALKASVSAEGKAVFESALRDPDHSLRSLALSQMNPSSMPEKLPEIARLSTEDPHSAVRGTAIGLLGETGDAQYAEQARKIIDKEQAYPVIAAALNTLQKLDAGSAQTYAQKFENDDNGSVINAVGNIFASANDVGKINFFETNWGKVDGPAILDFIGNYMSLVLQTDESQLNNSIAKLQGVATDMSQSPWRRFGVTKNLNDLRMFYQEEQTAAAGDAEVQAVTEEKVKMITDVIEDIKSKETNGQLQAIYGNF